MPRTPRHQSTSTSRARARPHHGLSAAEKSSLCEVCGEHPRLSVLRRCLHCLQEQVERDRKALEAKLTAAKEAKAAANRARHAEWKLPKSERARCGAKTRAGHPCKRLPIEGKARCRNHGGCSTGPVTAEGLARSTANLAKSPSWQKRSAARRSASSP